MDVRKIRKGEEVIIFSKIHNGFWFKEYGVVKSTYKVEDNEYMVEVDLCESDDFSDTTSYTIGLSERNYKPQDFKNRWFRLYDYVWCFKNSHRFIKMIEDLNNEHEAKLAKERPNKDPIIYLSSNNYKQFKDKLDRQLSKLKEIAKLDAYSVKEENGVYTTYPFLDKSVYIYDYYKPDIRLETNSGTIRILKDSVIPGGMNNDIGVEEYIDKIKGKVLDKVKVK